MEQSQRGAGLCHDPQHIQAERVADLCNAQNVPTVYAALILLKTLYVDPDDAGSVTYKS